MKRAVILFIHCTVTVVAREATYIKTSPVCFEGDEDVLVRIEWFKCVGVFALVHSTLKDVESVLIDGVKEYPGHVLFQVICPTVQLVKVCTAA